jgi:TetR/AcrR family transcriptional regulator of autoinduction and epiphytic fitness
MRSSLRAGKTESVRDKGDVAVASRDGRIARGIRTRESILQAYGELIVDAAVPPTGAELAARARVSARSVFTHFNDMDGVLAAAARLAFEWVVRTHVDILPDLPLDDRLDRFVKHQAEVLERTAPLYRMLRAVRHGVRREQCSPEVSEILAGVDQIRRRWIHFVFSWEFDACPGLDCDDLLEAVMVCSSWNAWEGLRHELDLDVDRASGVMRLTLKALLS